jgi:membrane-bound lytic murein transglycosylase D
MNRKILLLLALTPFALNAQNVVTDTDIDDDEIEVLDEEGDGEEFDFPEALVDNNLDSLMNLYMSRTYLSTDGGCQPLKENPTFTREEYIDRLSRMPTVMEMPYNDVVRSCIDLYMVRLRRQVSFMLGASNFYMPIFEEALDAYQLPLELKYLPIIESALNPNAYSHAGACGLWQFILSTAKMYNLEVNSLVDERRDPVKSSYAAAHFLSDLYKIFGDWNLVIAAYNCGPENVNRAIRRSGERDYWKIYPYLPKETRGYVPAFIAANYAMNYYCEHGICPLASKLPAKTDTVMVTKNVSFQTIADATGLSLDMIRSLNSVYRRDMVPGLTKPSPLRLPLAEISKFIDKEDSIYAMASRQVFKRTEVEIEDRPVVSKQPTKRERTRTTTTRGGKNSKNVRGAKNTRRGKSTGGGKNAKGGKNSYVTVKKGDTLSSIAKRSGTTVAKLKKINGMSGNTIRSGKKIRVK